MQLNTKVALSPSHSVLTAGQPIPGCSQYRQASVRAAPRVAHKSLVRGIEGSDPTSPALVPDASLLGHWGGPINTTSIQWGHSDRLAGPLRGSYQHHVNSVGPLGPPCWAIEGVLSTPRQFSGATRTSLLGHWGGPINTTSIQWGHSDLLAGPLRGSYQHHVSSVGPLGPPCWAIEGVLSTPRQVSGATRTALLGHWGGPINTTPSQWGHSDRLAGPLRGSYQHHAKSVGPLGPPCCWATEGVPSTPRQFSGDIRTASLGHWGDPINTTSSQRGHSDRLVGPLRGSYQHHVNTAGPLGPPRWPGG